MPGVETTSWIHWGDRTLSVASWPGTCVGGEVGGSQGSQVSPTSSLPTAGGPPHLRVLTNFNNFGKLRTSLSVRGGACSQVLTGRRRNRSVGQGHVAATYVYADGEEGD